jgi:hypothetical protein
MQEMLQPYRDGLGINLLLGCRSGQSNLQRLPGKLMDYLCAIFVEQVPIGRADSVLNMVNTPDDRHLRLIAVVLKRKTDLKIIHTITFKLASCSPEIRANSKDQIIDGGHPKRFNYKVDGPFMDRAFFQSRRCIRRHQNNFDIRIKRKNMADIFDSQAVGQIVIQQNYIRLTSR